MVYPTNIYIHFSLYSRKENPDDDWKIDIGHSYHGLGVLYMHNPDKREEVRLKTKIQGL